jgi:hypothetical protein
MALIKTKDGDIIAKGFYDPGVLVSEGCEVPCCGAFAASYLDMQLCLLQPACSALLPCWGLFQAAARFPPLANTPPSLFPSPNSP